MVVPVLSSSLSFATVSIIKKVRQRGCSKQWAVVVLGCFMALLYLCLLAWQFFYTPPEPTPDFPSALLVARRRSAACPYRISSRGKDGVGHQMEGKLSCLATAAALNMTYVHFPLTTLEHNEDPMRMEHLWGLSRTVSKLLSFDDTNNHNTATVSTALYSNESMLPKVQKRLPVPYVGHCNEVSWFDYKLRERPDVCDRDTAVSYIHVSDNCWDYLWCHTDSLSTVWQQTMVPLLQESFLEGFRAEGTDRTKERGTLYVVLHVRKGDAGQSYRNVEYEWYSTVLHNLVLAAPKRGIAHVHVTIHSNDPHETIQKMIPLKETASMAVTIYGSDDSEATLERALYDMIMADIFVASASSLSHAAALMRSLPVLYPPSDERPRMVHLGWSMLKVESNGFWKAKKVHYCARPPPPFKGRVCEEWQEATDDFWSQVVATVEAREAERFSPL